MWQWGETNPRRAGGEAVEDVRNVEGGPGKHGTLPLWASRADVASAAERNPRGGMFAQRTEPGGKWTLQGRKSSGGDEPE